MVAQRNHIRPASLQQTLRNLGGEPEPSGGVFGVYYNKVGAILAPERGQERLGELPPRLSDHVADHQDPHQEAALPNRALFRRGGTQVRYEWSDGVLE